MIMLRVRKTAKMTPRKKKKKTDDTDDYVPSSSSSEDERLTPLKGLKKRKICDMSSSDSDDE